MAWCVHSNSVTERGEPMKYTTETESIRMRRLRNWMRYMRKCELAHEVFILALDAGETSRAKRARNKYKALTEYCCALP